MLKRRSSQPPPSVEVQEEALRRAQALAQGLYPHQVEGLAFLLARRGAVLADDMGLGKTRQAILGLTTAAPEGPYLVVCPASVKRNWAREIELVRPGSDVHVVGDAPPGDWKGWVVVNYDVLGRHVDALLALGFAGIVFDEAHYLKNHTSQRSRLGTGRLVEERADRPVTYLLTGTPLTNRPRDLFPLLQLVQHPLGRSFLSFARRYCAAEHNGFGWVTDGASNLEELAIQLKGVLIRRTKDEVLDLPPKVRTFLDVEVPESTAVRETRKVLELLLGLGPGPGRAGRGRRTELLARLTRARHVLAKAKVKATLDFVGGTVAQGEKVLVFSCFDEPLRKIQERFGEQCVLLTGRTPAGRRQKLVDRFQGDPGVTVFAANIQAGGVGLNLTAARQVVFNDLDWVPASHWQAEDRAYRIGQTGSVHVAYMVAEGTVDSFVKSVLEIKARLSEGVVDGKVLKSAAVRSALAELESLVAGISPGLADEGLDRSDPGFARELLTRAAAAYRARHAPADGPDDAPAGAQADLLEKLARALGGPESTIYRIASGSDPARSYTLTVEGLDVTCTCPGFEYRGMCRHARELKTALAQGDEPPAGYLRDTGP